MCSNSHHPCLVNISTANSTSAHSLHSLLLSRFSRVRLRNPIDGSLPGSSVPGILQARILEWVAISCSSACRHAKSLQSCPTLCDPVDSSPPDSSAHGIFQARVLEWVAIAFSKGGTLQTKNTGVCSQCLGHTGFAPTHGICAFPVYTA